MTMEQDALAFFDACETGKGWDVCRQWCHADATFAAQADTLADVTTLESYTDWMKSLGPAMPDAHYEMLAFAADEARSAVLGAAIFKATHTGDAGNGPPTGKSTASHYCYVIQYRDGKISHMVKIWNDLFALRELGWA